MEQSREEVELELEKVNMKVNYITEKLSQCKCMSMLNDLDFLNQQKLKLQTKLFKFITQ